MDATTRTPKRIIMELEKTLNDVTKIEDWLVANSGSQDIDLLTRIQVKLAGFKAFLCGQIGQLDIELATVRKTRKIEQGRLWVKEKENGASSAASEVVAKYSTTEWEGEEILVEGNLNRLKRHVDGIGGILDATRQRVAYLRDEYKNDRQ